MERSYLFPGLFSVICCLFLSRFERVRNMLTSSFKHFLIMDLDLLTTPFYAEDECDDDIISNKSIKFLDKYSKKDIEEQINTTNLPNKLKTIGITDWYIDFDLSDPITHRAYIRSKALENDKSKFIAFMAANHGKYGESYDILGVKWFALQNPLASFTKEGDGSPSLLRFVMKITNFW